MYTILEKRVLAENIYLMRIHAPRVARAAKPGQFIIVRIDEFGERVPLTISDYDAEQGSVTIVTQAIGASTRKLCALEQGDALADFVGPLGHPSEFIHEDLDTLRKKRFLFVAGGVGTAPVYPQVKWLHEHGVKADVIIGAKTKSMLIYTEEMARVADNLYIATDDGSEGFKGMVTALIKDLIDNRGKQYDVCVAIGPMIMMKFVTLTTKEYSLPTVVSLNTLMVDGTGMCGACRVTVGGTNVKPSRMVKVGETVSVRKPPITYSFKILQAIEQRVGAKLIPQVYENVTTPDQYELLEMTRISGFVDRARGTAPLARCVHRPVARRLRRLGRRW